MSKYCTLCERKVDPIKAPWSWLFFLLWVPTFGVVYVIYHFIFKKKTRCPVCKTKKLEKHSPAEIQQMQEKKQENKEARKETMDNAANFIKGKMNGE